MLKKNISFKFREIKEFKRKEGAILGKILLFAKKTVKIDILFSRFSENS